MKKQPKKTSHSQRKTVIKDKVPVTITQGTVRPRHYYGTGNEFRDAMYKNRGISTNS